MKELWNHQATQGLTSEEILALGEGYWLWRPHHPRYEREREFRHSILHYEPLSSSFLLRVSCAQSLVDRSDALYSGYDLPRRLATNERANASQRFKLVQALCNFDVKNDASSKVKVPLGVWKWQLIIRISLSKSFVANDLIVRWPRSTPQPKQNSQDTWTTLGSISTLT